MKKLLAAVSGCAILAGCASAPNQITAEYVSPEQYTDYSCRQIREEMQDVSMQVRSMAAAQSGDRRRDEVAWGVGLVLFWPALAFLAEGDHKDELAGLKGQYDALKEASIRKDCASLNDEMEADRTAAQQRAANNPPAVPADAQPAAAAPRCGTVPQRDGTLKLVAC
jgi:hypothetical protein